MPEDIKLCEIIGSFGKYQFVLITLSFAASTFSGYMPVTMQLLAPAVDLHWDWDASSPNKTIFRSTECRMEEILQHNNTANHSNAASILIYESKYSRQTLTEKLTLICERSWLASFANTMALIGSFVASLVISRLSEIYGRTRCTIWMAFLCLLSNISILFSQGYVMLVLAFTVYGAIATNMYFYIFFQVLEITPVTWAGYSGAFCMFSILCGQTLLVGAAWLTEDWFYTQVFHTAFAGAFFISFFYALESPVWLSVRGRYDEAKDTIIKMLIRNGCNPEEAKPKIEEYLEQMKHRCEIQSKAEKGKFSDLFKNRVIIFYTLALSASRGFVFVMYYGFVMNAQSFGSGLYMDLTISNAFCLGSVVLSSILLTKFSIRTQLVVLCICGGITCIVYTFISEIPIARSASIILGRCFIVPVAAMMLVYSNQIVPTSVRGVSCGFRTTVSGLFSSLTPFTKELGKETALYVPFILFAGCGFVSAALYKMLPETKEKELAHTVDEIVKKKRTVPQKSDIITTKL